MNERDLKIVIDPAADEFFDATLALTSALKGAGIDPDHRQVQVTLPREDMTKLIGHCKIPDMEFEANRLQFLTPAPDRERQARFTGVERLKNRRGCIHIDAGLIDTDPVAFAAVMGWLIVTRCEALWHLNKFEFIALSPAFEPVDRGYITPEYSVTIHRRGPVPDGWCDVSFERVQ